MRDNHQAPGRRTLLTGLALALVASACVSSNDPRLGEDERVRFVGGGCTSSTTLAVASRVTLSLQSATEDPLPGDLSVASADPTVIKARMGLEPATIQLTAGTQGESEISILSEGDVIDSLPFKVQPAGQVNHTAEPRVFVGGALDIVVSDVFGDCGAQEECRLLGDTFLLWRMEPPTSGNFVIDFDGVATFRAKTEGPATVFGKEPLRGSQLVEAPLDIVAASQAKSLTATLTTIPLDPEVKSEVFLLPGKAKLADAFSVRVDAVLMDGGVIPISWRDVEWRVEGNEIVVPSSASDAGDRFGRLFITAGPGTVTLVADVPIIGLTQPFAVELTSP